MAIFAESVPSNVLISVDFSLGIRLKGEAHAANAPPLDTRLHALKLILQTLYKLPAPWSQVKALGRSSLQVSDLML